PVRRSSPARHSFSRARPIEEPRRSPRPNSPDAAAHGFSACRPSARRFASFAGSNGDQRPAGARAVGTDVGKPFEMSKFPSKMAIFEFPRRRWLALASGDGGGSFAANSAKRAPCSGRPATAEPVGAALPYAPHLSATCHGHEMGTLSGLKSVRTHTNIAHFGD